jgi:hypothetical protein
MVCVLGRTHTDYILLRSLEITQMNHVLKFIFCFPRADDPTDEELERMEEYIIAFYELRHNLEAFTLAHA